MYNTTNMTNRLVVQALRSSWLGALASARKRRLCFCFSMPCLLFCLPLFCVFCFICFLCVFCAFCAFCAFCVVCVFLFLVVLGCFVCVCVPVSFVLVWLTRKTDSVAGFDERKRSWGASTPSSPLLLRYTIVDPCFQTRSTSTSSFSNFWKVQKSTSVCFLHTHLFLDRSWPTFFIILSSRLTNLDGILPSLSLEGNRCLPLSE